jgi:hypothetical protein
LFASYPKEKRDEETLYHPDRRSSAFQPVGMCQQLRS